MQKVLPGILISFLIIVTAGMCSGCSVPDLIGVRDESVNSDSEALAVEEDITYFKVGMEDNEPFTCLNDEGEYIGSDVDMAKEVCARNGWEFVAVEVEADKVSDALESGGIDCFWSGFYMEGRESDYTWSRSYSQEKYVFVVPAESEITSKKDLAGKVVAAVGNSGALKAFDAPENSDFTESLERIARYRDSLGVLNALNEGKADAAVLPAQTVKEEIDAWPDEPFVVLSGDDDLLLQRTYAVAFLKGNEDLMSIVEETLDEIEAEEFE